MSDDFAAQQQAALVNALADLKDGPKLSLQQGANLVRVLPRFKDDGTPELYFWENHVLHWKVGPNNKLVRCLRPDGVACFVCEYVAQLAQAGHTEAAKDMQASARFIMGAIQIRGGEAKVKTLECGPQILEAILDYATNPEWGDSSNPTTGYNLTITKSGTGFGTKYGVTPSRERSAIDNAFLQMLPDLKNYYTTFTYEQQQMIIAGQDPTQAVAPMSAPPQMPAGAAPPQQVATPAQPAPPSAVETPAQPAPPSAVAPPAAVAPTATTPPESSEAPLQAAPAAPPAAPLQGAPPPSLGSPVGGAVVTGGENVTPVVEAAPPQQPTEFQGQPPAPPQQ